MSLKASLLVVFGVIARLVAADEVSDALSATPTATIASGQIIGTTTSIAGPSVSVVVNKFLGIPFAAAPTGSARFTTPKGPAEWTSPLKTQKFSSSCIQVFVPPAQVAFAKAVYNNPAPTESEDCLYLNVFAPKKAWTVGNPPYPVLYWMYGGGWRFGNAGQPWYDGSQFAGLEDVIVVTVNYRTNAFGLPIAPTIANLTERNLALLDQRAGLQWVQDNIHHFGGDKSKVTIFGESAGSYAVDILITSYTSGAARPFHASIMESGTYAYLQIANCQDTNYAAWNALAAGLNCTGTDATIFSCVKNDRTADQLRDAQMTNVIGGLKFVQACDNVTYVSNPRQRLEAGNVADVPVFLGTNQDDGSFFTWVYANNSDLFFSALFPTVSTTLKNAILAEYPLGKEGRTDTQFQLQQIYRDWSFHCPTSWYAETSNKFKTTYRYIYNATFTNTRGQYASWPTKYQGAYHISEVPLVFSTYNSSDLAPSDEVAAEISLSNAMRGAWANFAKDPTKAPVTGASRAARVTGGWDVVVWGTDGKGKIGASVLDSSTHCDFWEAQGFKQTHL